MDNEEENRIENVIGKQNKNKFENTLYHVNCSKVKMKMWNLLTGIPQRTKVYLLQVIFVRAKLLL